MARPRKFDNAGDLQEKIESYFIKCEDEKKPYTVSGLCVHLDVTRETLSQYEKKKEFSDTIKKAKTMIENWIEENALLNKLNSVVAIFNLKNNFGWKDKQELEHSGGIDYNMSEKVKEYAK